MAGRDSMRTGAQASGKRNDHELPAATAVFGWRYHHLGIPTADARPGERYLAPFKMYVSGFEESPYGIEWMRFEEESPVAALVKTRPHIAFAVDDLDVALEGKEVLLEAAPLSGGGRVAMIVHDGAPVELLEFPEPENAPNAGLPSTGDS